MKLLFLTFLLTLFSAVSMKSPIFGPQEVQSVEGGSASITCYYPDTSVNRHSRKYWCRQGAKGRCTTLISSEGYVSEEYRGRANLTNFPESNTFVVDIGHLTQSDIGHYKCGLGISSRGLSFDVSLEVRLGPGLVNDTQIYTADLGGTVTINCPFKAENSQKKKSVCKNIGQLCVLVTDSNGYVNPSYSGRAKLSIQGTSQLAYSLVISNLRLSDAGMYVCQAGDDSSHDKRNADLQVIKPEPELLYGDLRGSVTFDCALDPEKAKGAQFLCRVGSGEDCDVIINTLGKRAQNFEGRILLLLSDKKGLFSVHITGLRKEDAGLYLCGADSHGQPQDGSPTQAWELFVNEESVIPRSPSVVKGVVGGSVAVLCSYNPKETNSFKYWCRWENGQCLQLVGSKGLVKEQYEGRLALYEEPGNGTYTVILNQLTAQDAGFYWCLTSGDPHWRSTVELKIVEGEPSLKAPENVTAWLDETLQLPCHFPCKYYAYEKYWCKWSKTGCRTLPSKAEGPSQAFTDCNQRSQLVSLTLNPVTGGDEGWYWCGVKEGLRYAETVAVYVAVKQRVRGSQAVVPVNAAPSEEGSVRDIENKVIRDPSLFAEDRAAKDTGDLARGSGAPTDPDSSAGHSGGSHVLVSTLVPLALVLALGAVAVAVVRARHRKNVDRVSIRSYRTDISMSDFDNSRDFGANENTGASSITQETSLEGKDELSTTAEGTTQSEEPKKPKRSSKEEADMAYTAFLLQANSMAADAPDGPTEA
ncbi:Polymeric immunoglobulin receptor [Manis javanica]|nr:Polymeric immunoglobulin receptor [Manis javanica]